ncbi:ProQ/FinO family protein [Cupriavidus sp. TMH.W2]|uniref:ProQ/FinO family protein n=1 Tax=Cupriavidus sp. TMH.W2 TaxID=3434465 RepID=UPI003D78199C
MGFEQLAALRDQLAKKAAAESGKGARQGARKGTPNGERTGTRDGERTAARSGAGADAPAGAKGRRPAPTAAQAKPVDPVVHSIARLQKHFPKAFPKNPAPKVPLKVGTFEDLTQHAARLALNEAELREAIRTWCSGARYWSCMVEGAKRLDLEGNEAGVVSEADAKRARQLKARRAGGSRPPKAKPATAATPATPETPETHAAP